MFLDTAPMGDDMLMEFVYRIFTARVGVELELGRALSRLGARSGSGMAMQG